MSSIPKLQSKANPRVNGLAPRKKRFFAVLAVLFTPVFFLTLELALRLFHYGSEYNLVLTTSSLGKQYYMINPTVGRRYFNPQRYSLPEIDADVFEVLKSSHTCRVFVLGESTASEGNALGSCNAIGFLGDESSGAMFPIGFPPLVEGGS